MSESQPASERTRVRRSAARGVYDRDAIDRILDGSLLCHVGIIDDGRPFVIPTLHVRHDDRLFIHGSTQSRLMRIAGSGAPVCVTVTLLDGIVLARSVFHHSMNYRSVLILANGSAVTGDAEKLLILERLVEHVLPGRWNDARRPSQKELKATSVVGFPLDECSAKVRQGPPQDDEADYGLPHWAGVVPLRIVPAGPMPDPRLRHGIEPPAYLKRFMQATVPASGGLPG